MQPAPPSSTIVTHEIQIVDVQGHPPIILSAADGRPIITLLDKANRPATTVALNEEDRPSIKLANPDPNGPVGSLEVDDKGAHVLFAKPGGASLYLFLNNAGMSGVVLIDAHGMRAASVVVGADGALNVEARIKGATRLCRRHVIVSMYQNLISPDRLHADHAECRNEPINGPDPWPLRINSRYRWSRQEVP